MIHGRKRTKTKRLEIKIEIGIFAKYKLNPMKRLAIVIPAYKPQYLAETLESICTQSDRGFTVYIGDDASPADLATIVRPFSQRMDIRYHRFEENMGGKDLVGHWERCLRMIEQEDYIWLFSDDDKMPPDAVERLRAHFESYPGHSFYRFPLSRIDANGRLEYAGAGLEEGIQSAEDMLTDYFAGVRPSSACEYIFSRALFEQEGMIHFPLAWCSDVATWYRYAQCAGGAVNIPGAAMMWRNAANVNISSTDGLQEQKMQALILFMQWLKEHYKNPSDRKFKKALYQYIKANLEISFSGVFSRDSFLTLVARLKQIDLFLSLRVLYKYRSRLFRV